MKTVWTYVPFGNLAHDLFFVSETASRIHCVRSLAALSARVELSRASHSDAARLRAAGDCEETGAANEGQHLRIG